MKYLYALMLCMPLLRADFVELRDGRRFEGTILSERSDGIEIQIGQNEAGTIKRVLHIHASEIRSYAADAAGRRPGQERQEVSRLSGSEYIERLLRDAEKKVQVKDYDAAVEEFLQAAEVAGQTGESDEEQVRVEALELRAHALRLTVAALEGKVELIETRTDGVEDGLKEEKDRLEDEWEELNDEIREAEKSSSGRKIEIGQGPRSKSKGDLEQRKEDLQIEIIRFRQRSREMSTRLRQLEEDKAQAEAQIKIVEERVEQAEENAKLARKSMERRR